MRSWAQPTADEIRRVEALAARPENRAYFFDRLENPLWVAPLAERGFFADPPSPIPAGEPGYVRFPPWPEGRYLARVASSAPDAVARVLADIPRSENPTVTQNLLGAVLALPDAQLRSVSTRIADWVEGQFAEYFADEAADLIARLLETGDLPRGISVAATLLAVQPDPRLAEKAAMGDSHTRPHPEAVGRMSDWNYERVLERLLRPMVEGAGMEGVRLLSTLLDDALRMSRWDSEASDSHSYIWRPAIEDHGQNSDSGLKNVLTSALRNAAAALSAQGDEELVDVLRALESGSPLHRRIALHVLASTESGSSLVDERLGDRQLFDDYRVKHEYASLLRHRYRDASEETQRRVLQWIHAGPDLDEYRERRIQFDGVDPSDDEVQRYVRIWQRDWYSFLAQDLEDGEADRFQALVAELGEAEHPDFLSWSSSWVGPESPLTRDELLARSPDDVIEFLRTWRRDSDSESRFGPSREGLGRVLMEVTKERAPEYAAVAERLTDVDPTYVRSLFSGLEAALKEGGAFGWDEPLALARFAVQQPFETDEDVPDRDRDPGWRWCRREVASLLRTGFADRASRIPFRYRDDAWYLVDRLTSDPNPSPEHEQRYGGDNMDPFTLSINTNRGTAMHAVVEYALWTRRELESAGDDVSVGFEAMPEVREVLEHHLDPSVDPSLAVRSVYGRWLPWLLLLDEEWVLDHIHDVLPAAPEQSRFRDAAWSTYISWCPPYDSVFRVLSAEYEAAIRRVPSDSAAGRLPRENVDVKLGEHLLTFYWRGVADDQVLEEFLGRADDELASDVMEFIGRALRNTEGEISESVGQHIQELWDRRLAVAATDPEAHRLETRAFGMSFASGKLDHAWALEALERAVAISGAPRLGHLVVEKLAQVAVSDPKVAARVLASMLERPENEWDHIGWRDEARSIVAAAASSSDPSVVESCGAIVDFYVRRGELDFRDLLPKVRPRRA